MSDAQQPASNANAADADNNRTALRDAGGNVVLTYLRGDRDGRPWADLVELAPRVGVQHAAEVAREALAGWVFSGDETLTLPLLNYGAIKIRHAHVYSWNLVDNPPAPSWATLEPHAGLRVVAADRPAQDLAEAAHAAYPPEHVDSGDDHDETIASLLEGRAVGPLLPESALVVDARDVVVAACLVNKNSAPAPFGGPWVGDVFRRPEPAYAGLGSLLLRRALAQLALNGHSSLGLAVTDGNPAQKTYERIGFKHLLTSVTVQLPD